MNGERFTDRLNGRVQHLDSVLNQPRLVFGYFTHNLVIDHRHEKIRTHLKFTVENLTQIDLPMPELVFTLDSSIESKLNGECMGKSTAPMSGRHQWDKKLDDDGQIRLHTRKKDSCLQRNQKVRIDQMYLDLPMDKPDQGIILSAYIDFGKNSIYSKPALNTIEIHSLEKHSNF
ncbi:hypothetical protein [Halobacillus hunanensis]|uniref:hypothetical protein n=1 Tax=Halobacillus hunanensis TaxID=578214 RepID=UPI0009A8856F|nr:hypothetical protein [Halobacillus hunanensis]